MNLVRRLRPMARVLRPMRRLLLITITVGAANQAATVASGAIGAYLVGRAATGASVDQLRPWLWAVGAAVLARTLLPWLETLLAHVMAFRVLVDIRERLHAAFERLAPAYLLERRSGDLGATVVSDIEKLEIFFAHTLGPLVVAFAVPFASLIVLGVLHPILPLVVLPTLVLVASVPSWLQRRADIQGQEVRDRSAELSADVVDGVQGLREVLVFGDGDRQLDRLDRAGRSLIEAQNRHGRRTGVERGAIDAVVTIGMVLVLGVSAYLTTASRLDAASLPVAVTLAALSFAPVTALAEQAKELNVVAAAADRVQTVLDAQPAVVDRVDAAPVGPIDPTVAFRNVTFRYHPDLPNAVEGVSFEIGREQTVALVGRSGAGKSTLAHLLMRFWDVGSGAIEVGGHDIRDMRQSDLRDLIGFVPQDTYLFNASVAENIRLGRPDAADDDVIAAAVAARADEFITALPDGYETTVGERGAQLSGGERQRIALARALLKDAPILVMDEPLSNLDSENERALSQAWAAAGTGRTVLVIAHRLSTIRAADIAVALENGTVQEVGPHDQLIARGGRYAALMATQTAPESAAAKG